MEPSNPDDQRGRRLLYRQMAGEELTPAEQRSLEARLERDPDLRAERKELRKVETLVDTARVDSFGTGFSSRVMSRIERIRARRGAFAAVLLRSFRRLSWAALVLIVLLGGYNALSAGGQNETVGEALFGVPSATVEDAYTLTLYDTP